MYLDHIIEVNLPTIGRWISRSGAEEMHVEHPVLAQPRKLYPEFDVWWEKVREENRTCYVLKDYDQQVRGIAVIDPRASNEVKLCTFCLTVDERGTGLHFLRAVCASLASEGFKRVYGTVLPDQTSVLDFFKRAGFHALPPDVISKSLDTHAPFLSYASSQ